MLYSISRRKQTLSPAWFGLGDPHIKPTLSIPLENQKWRALCFAREFIWLSMNAAVGHTPLIL